jgi:hypothetical protein
MTVSAAIGIGTGGGPAPGLGRAMGALHGAGRTAAATQTFLPVMAEGAESFRAGWQSLLASLSSSGNGLGDSGAAAEQGKTFTGAAPGEAAAEPSGAAASLAAGLGPQLSQGTQGTEIGSGGTGARIEFRPAKAWAGELPIRPAAGTARTASTRAEEKEKKPTAEPGTEASASTRPTHSINVVHVVQPGAVAAEPMPGLALATAFVSLSQAGPAPLVPSKPSPSSDVKAQSAQADFSHSYLSSALPAGFASASYRPEPLSLVDSSQAAGAAGAAMREGTEKNETLAKPAQVLPAPGPSWPSGPVPSATDLPNVQQSAPPRGTTRAEDGSPLQAARQNRNQTQTVATGIRLKQLRPPRNKFQRLRPMETRSRFSFQARTRLSRLHPV